MQKSRNPFSRKGVLWQSEEEFELHEELADDAGPTVQHAGGVLRQRSASVPHQKHGEHTKDFFELQHVAVCGEHGAPSGGELVPRIDGSHQNPLLTGTRLTNHYK